MRRAALLAVVALLAATAPAVAQGEGGAQQAPPDRQQRLTSAESYLPMPTVTAEVVQRYTTTGTLIVDMGIDVPDATFRNHAQLNAPRLRDALRTALSTYASVYYHDRTEPDPATLTRLMQTAVDRTLGATGARVLLANILYQRRAS